MLNPGASARRAEAGRDTGRSVLFDPTAPMYFAAAVMTITAVLTILVLPESLAVECHATSLSISDVHPFRAITDALKRSDLRPLLLLVFLSALGVINVIAQGGLLRVLLPRPGYAVCSRAS